MIKYNAHYTNMKKRWACFTWVALSCIGSQWCTRLVEAAAKPWLALMLYRPQSTRPLAKPWPPNHCLMTLPVYTHHMWILKYCYWYIRVHTGHRKTCLWLGLHVFLWEERCQNCKFACQIWEPWSPWNLRYSGENMANHMCVHHATDTLHNCVQQHGVTFLPRGSKLTL